MASTREPIETGKWPHVSHSSLILLSECEKKWSFKYVEGHELAPTVPMRRGSLFHRLWRAWWTAGECFTELSAFLEEWHAENPEAESLPDWIPDTVWLMERYEAHYADDFDKFEVIATEYPFKVRLPGKYGWLIGYFDALWKVDGELWVTELKTMSDFSRLESYTWDPQITLYHWAAQQIGLPVVGICLDAARTYRWTRDEHKHPPDHSFERRWLERNEEHDQEAVLDAIAGLDRMRQLRRGTRPLRNVGRDCNGCPVRLPCREQLAFGSLGEIELEEEDDAD